MKQLLSILFILVSQKSFSQKYQHFYDYNWKVCDVSTASFLTTFEKKGDLWEREDFYIHTRSSQMQGSYKDTSFKVPHGLFNYYYYNKNLQYTGKYIDGKKEGLWLSYHLNTMMSDSSFYKNNQVIGTSLSWHPNGFLSDSSFYNEDGSGISVKWFEDGSIASAGRYSAGMKKHATWQYFHRNGKISALIVYDNGVTKEKQYFNEEGSQVDTTGRDHEAIFKGGLKGWKQYISSKAYFPRGYQIVNADIAAVTVEAVVDEEGKIGNINLIAPFHKVMNEIVVEALQRAPKWQPAIQFNRPVKYKIQQTVFFQQSEE